MEADAKDHAGAVIGEKVTILLNVYFQEKITN
jgi:hypothetical protein